MTAVPYSQYPRTYRWLIRLLPLGLVLTLAAFTIGAWALARSINDNSVATRRAQVINLRQERTIKSLCDRGYILLGLVESALNVAYAQRAAHLKADPRLVLADIAFIRTFEQAHAQIVDQLVDKTSPCVAGR